MRSPFFQKIITVFLGITISLTLIVAPIHRAQAVFPVTDFPAAIADSFRWFQETSLRLLGVALARSMWVVMRTHTQQFLTDSAKYLATGDKGQKPLILTKDFGDAFEDIGDAAGGQFIQEFGKTIGLGDLCTSTVQVGLQIALGLNPPPQPKVTCTLRQLAENWDVTSPQFLSNWTVSFDMRQNDLGNALRAYIAADDAEATKVAKEWLNRAAQAEFKAPTTAGNVKKSTKLSAEQLQELQYKKANDAATEFTGVVEADLVNLLMAFPTTFLGTYLKQYIQKGQYSLADLVHPSKTINSPYGGGTPGQQPGEEFSTTFLAAGVPSGSDFDLIAELSTCQDDQTQNGLYNCALEDGFRSAVTRGQSGDPLSVQQAIDADVLHGNWTFGYDASGQEPDFKAGYPYSIMLKLRRARIIPVGWELAAKAIADLGGNAFTLQDVVNCFEDPAAPQDKTKPDFCPRDGGGNNAFYRLVDPNWLIAAPQYKCNAQTNGQLNIGGSAIREQYCADIQDCVKEDGNGNCIAWGYCTREKNTWKFTANSCEPEFASCRVYSRTVDNQEFAFLENTVNINGCTASNVGCTWYSTQRDAQGNWQDTSRIYFSRNISQDRCAAGEDGCREFLSLKDINQNAAGLDSNADGFVDTKEVHAAVQNDAEKDAKYADFASVASVYLNGSRLSCTEAEVGCNMYTSEDGQFEVSAVPQSQDFCPAQCVGYQTYKQESNFFEAEQFIDFIAATGQQCSAADVGCSEFTNLDAAESGGESIVYYKYLRRCQKPAPETNTCAFYYTWESTGNNAFQLRTHLLQASGPTNATKGLGTGNEGTGAPVTTDGSGDCDLTSDQGCTEFFDQDGNAHRRIFKSTVSCSNFCFNFRKTESSQSDCLASMGQWNAAAQECIYKGIPDTENTPVEERQSESCSSGASNCRAFTGSTGDNIVRKFTHAFENLNANEVAQYGQYASLSSVNLRTGENSLQLGGGPQNVPAYGELDITSGLIERGRTYILKFDLANSVSTVTDIDFAFGQSAFASSGFLINPTPIGRVTTNLSEASPGGWRSYTLGPVEFNRDFYSMDRLYIRAVVAATGTNSLDPIYLDNIVLEEIQDKAYIIKRSWNTPCGCDTEANIKQFSPRSQCTASDYGASSALNCQAYTNPENERFNLKQLSQLCAPEVIGCEAMIDTQNSSSPYEQTFNTTNTGTLDDLTVSADQVVFVVNDASKYCDQEAKGCSALGLPELNGAGAVQGYSTVYYLNNPDRYEQTLCSEDHVGCEAYESREGFVFFKDPLDQTCEFKPVPNELPIRYAWFKKGDNLIPDHPDCLDAQNNSWTKECSIDQDMCTEFNEPITGDSFYYIKDDALDTSSCVGAVDWDQGCVLFNDTSNPDKIFTAQDQQLGINSSSTSGSVRACTDAGGNVVSNCDTNILLKVQKHRACGEWLQCLSSTTVFDPQIGDFKNVCYGVGRCQETASKQASQCSQWVRPNADVLTSASYQTRETSFGGNEYSGMSIPNQYPIELLRQVPFGVDSDGRPTDFQLTYIEKLEPEIACNAATDCPNPLANICRNGVCYEDKGVDGQSNEHAPKECRGFPEEDSPFPSSLATFDANGNISTREAAFDKANISQPGENAQCSYTKAVYQAGNRYYGVNTQPPGLVVGQRDYDANSKLESSTRYHGWSGYCLENDPSTSVNGDFNQKACLTWYPIDLVAGEVDLFNNSPKAGYKPSIDSQFYCVESKHVEYRSTYPPGGGTTKHYSIDAYLQASGTKQADALGIPWPYHPACVKVRRTFKSDYYRCVFTPYGGDGWYEDDGVDLAWETKGQICSKVVRVADDANNNKAWTNRLLHQDTGVYSISTLGYTPSQYASLYGQINPPVLGSPEQWGPATGIFESPVPLRTINPDEYASCSVCVIPNGESVGTCGEGSAPADVGKKCPFPANAGSPYACQGNLLYPQINSCADPGRTPVRNAQGQVPYPAQSESYLEGSSRLQEIFSKSYGAWQFNIGNGVCIGRCQGGINTGGACLANSDCEFENETYTCQQNVCLTGENAGQSCSSNTSCLAPGDGLCSAGVCQGGDRNGQSCSSDIACQPSAEFGECKKDSFCSDTGQACTTSADCPAGVCQANAQGLCLYTDVVDGEFTEGSCTLNSDCVRSNSGQCSGAQRACAGDGGLAGRSCSTGTDCNPNGFCGGTPSCSDGTAGSCSLGQACGSGQSNEYQTLLCPNGVCGAGGVCQGGTRNGQICLQWDTTIGAGALPVIAQPILDTTTAAYQEGTRGKFAINNKLSGNVIGYGGARVISTQFYGYNENGDQMPLREVRVAWDIPNQDDSISRGSLKNRKNQCLRVCSNDFSVSCRENTDCGNAACVPKTFGDTQEACLEDAVGSPAYFTFLNVYYCSGTNDPAWQRYGVTNACAYKPKVLISDNWGKQSSAVYGDPNANSGEGDMVIVFPPEG